MANRLQRPSEQIWNVPVRFEDVPETGRHIELHGDDRVRRGIAALAGVGAISRLDAAFDIARHGRDGLRVTGEVAATIEQTCVVTLEPMESEVVEAVDLLFQPARAPDQKGGGERAHAPKPVDHDTDEPPEPMRDGTVDLGAISMEFLLLGIDPYPRKPGAVFEQPAVHDATGGPFAALAALKRKDRGS